MLDAHSDQGKAAGGLPGIRAGELLVAELHAAARIQSVGVGMRERHRHVEIVGARGEHTDRRSA